MGELYLAAARIALLRNDARAGVEYAHAALAIHAAAPADPERDEEIRELLARAHAAASDSRTP